MCGIAGIFGDDNLLRARRDVLTMTHALERRGPDGHGLHQWQRATLGHRRLAIFDTSDAGAQPMLSADGRTGVVFNGAIYNFRELREQLESRQYTFRTQTDTEVLIHGYRAWGIDGLIARLHGMFAFALWDDAEECAYLVRDRLGVKPLLYALQDGRLAFASTAAALQQAGFADALDERAVAEFLEYGFVTEARSIYRDIQKLPPAHVLRWKAGSFSCSRYWTLAQVADGARVTFEESVERAEALFLDAVRMRLDADVPVGALLSGGVDSSLVCWAIAKLGRDITAYTVATPGDIWDESADAAETAKQLGIKHHVLSLDAKQAPDVKVLVSAFGEPFACASALGMLAVSGAVKREATVLLTGDGGDDAFLGYPRHRHYLHAQRFARFAPRWATPVWRGLRRLAPSAGPFSRASHFADYVVGGLGAVVAAHDGLPQFREYGMLGERLRDATTADRTLPWSVDGGRRLLGDFIGYELRTRFVSEYLAKVDGSTMRYGLEARSPFLDQDLWTFAASLPYDVRLHGNTLKAILREIARRNIGERVASGKKRGFGIPAQRWITGAWRKDVDESFRYSLLEREGWLKADAVRRVLRSLAPGETAPVQLWHAYVLETWMKERAFSAQLRPVDVAS